MTGDRDSANLFFVFHTIEIVDLRILVVGQASVAAHVRVVVKTLATNSASIRFLGISASRMSLLDLFDGQPSRFCPVLLEQYLSFRGINQNLVRKPHPWDNGCPFLGMIQNRKITNHEARRILPSKSYDSFPLIHISSKFKYTLFRAVSYKLKISDLFISSLLKSYRRDG